MQTIALQVSYLHHRELIKPVTKTSNAWDKLAYYRIANHYKYIFKTFFDCFEYPHVIILEVSHLLSILDQISSYLATHRYLPFKIVVVSLCKPLWG